MHVPDTNTVEGLNEKDFEHVLRPAKRVSAPNLADLWRYRSLVYMLVIREVQGKYRQSVLGFAWAFMPALTQMLIFTVLFGEVAQLGPDNIPYPIFSYAALLPWTFFATALTSAGGSVVSGRGLFTKVYFPRLVLPLAGVCAALVDLAISSVIMGLLMLYFGVVPGIEILLLPVFILIAIGTALGVGLWLTAASVKYRDVKFATPFMVQIWMYITPVIFSLDKIPEEYRYLLWLNPMTGVIEGFRWALVGQAPPEWSLMGLSLGVIAVILIGGVIYFTSFERKFADIV